MKLILDTSKGTWEPTPCEILELAKTIVNEAKNQNLAFSSTLKQLQDKFPNQTRLSVHQAAIYLEIGRDSLMHDNRFYKKLVKPGKSTRYISIANLADYIDGK